MIDPQPLFIYLSSIMYHVSSIFKAVDAAVVRIMKSRKVLSHNDLVSVHALKPMVFFQRLKCSSIIVFDEFRCTQGPHVDTMLRGVGEQSIICEEFRHRETAGRLPGL